MGIPFLKFTEDELFPIVNLVFPAWALLALLPRWKYTAPVVRMVALSYSVLYVVLFFDMMVLNPINISANDFNSLDGLLNFFSFKSATFVGWVHYIAFDLWTGMWITQDANSIKFPQLLLIPCLFFTCMLGPVGLVIYFSLKNMMGYKTVSKAD